EACRRVQLVDLARLPVDDHDLSIDLSDREPRRTSECHESVLPRGDTGFPRGDATPSRAFLRHRPHSGATPVLWQGRSAKLRKAAIHRLSTPACATSATTRP